uniref:Uncharacterized protein n=1 Tax=Physcomitrium patens TaxID=3218 RepID=A0A2K1INQ0_PHYPA|nr:hypothetical protein PHYPA_027222 [Physcomitrium patens]
MKHHHQLVWFPRTRFHTEQGPQVDTSDGIHGLGTVSAPLQTSKGGFPKQDPAHIKNPFSRTQNKSLHLEETRLVRQSR